tara:strand:- start:2330 stop:2536 length:207 start_codon:yes stop_codon:yes gene_type:complete
MTEYYQANNPRLMTNVGYTAGLRSKPNFAWTKNLIGEQTKTEKLSHKTSCWLNTWMEFSAAIFPERGR